MLKGLSCCIKCFERFIRFLNKHAFIEIALTGKNFCNAAKDGFFLILRNSVRFSLVAGLGNIIITIGSVFIGIASAIICYGVLNSYKYYQGKIFNPLFPTIVSELFLMNFNIWKVRADIRICDWIGFSRCLWNGCKYNSSLLLP